MKFSPWLLCFLLSPVPAYPLDLHVSPNGSDSCPGTLEHPLASLDGAREALRSLEDLGEAPQGGTRVLIHAGDYRLSESWKLGPRDSGSADSPIVYAAAPGEMVRFLGSREIPLSAFTAIQDASLIARILPEARDHVLSAGLTALGIADLGTFPEHFENAPLIPELFYRGERMTLARWPNEGWAEAAEIIESGPAPWRKHESDQLGVFRYEGDRPEKWLQAPSIWLHGYWCFDWSSETIRVKQIDVDKKHITLAHQHHYGLGSGNPGPRRFYATNLLEELDRPGEYFLDRDSGTLFFWPPGPLEPGSVVLSTLTAPVFHIKGCSYLTLQGLVVENTAGVGIQMEGGEHNRILACRVANTGQTGIVVEGGTNHRVEACDIHDTGTTGLRISGGDRKTLSPSGHEVTNNHIWRISRRQRTHANHLEMAGVGIHVAHNLLHDAPHQSILLSGNDHLIELNEIHHVCLETDDCGAFYMGRNPSDRGTIIRNNYWHDLGSERAHGSCAVYFDDGAGGQTVTGNVFYRAAGGSFGAVFLHGGHDNTVEHNLFIDCKRAIGHAPWNDQTWKEWIAGDLWKTRLLEEVDIASPTFLNRYPDLKDYMQGDSRPRINHAIGNVVVDCTDFINGSWEEKDNWITDRDPGFADKASHDFALKEDSEVFQKVPGFEAIPFDKIGLKVDELRPEVLE